MLGHPQPLQGCKGGVEGLEGDLVPYYQKSCVISILGFSIVGNMVVMKIILEFNTIETPEAI